jgi:hypothetical protein
MESAIGVVEDGMKRSFGKQSHVEQCYQTGFETEGGNVALRRERLV